MMPPLVFALLSLAPSAVGRRAALSAFSAATCAGVVGPAHAGFLSGTPPEDLGVRADGTLKGCPDSPNCWSTSGDAKHLIKPFEFSKPRDQAIADLVSVLESYPQAGIPVEGGAIDAGGNKVVQNDGKGYVRMEFVAKRGFVDDAEWYVGNDGKVIMRSASRLGDSDFGVNAARLKYVGAKLAEKGSWKADLGI